MKKKTKILSSPNQAVPIKDGVAIDKDAFYLFRIGENYTYQQMADFKKGLKESGLKGVIIQANDLDVIKINKETYKLIKEETK